MDDLVPVDGKQEGRLGLHGFEPTAVLAHGELDSASHHPVMHSFNRLAMNSHEQLSTENPRSMDEGRVSIMRYNVGQHLPRRRALSDSLWAPGDADSLPFRPKSCRPPPYPS